MTELPCIGCRYFLYFSSYSQGRQHSCDYSWRHNITFNGPPLSGVISHIPRPKNTLGMALWLYHHPILFVSLKSGYRTYLTTPLRRKTHRHVFTIYKQISTKIKKNKIGLTLLGNYPQWSRHFCRGDFWISSYWFALTHKF